MVNGSCSVQTTQKRMCKLWEKGNGFVRRMRTVFVPGREKSTKSRSPTCFVRGREKLILHCLQPPPRTQTKCLIGIRVACHPPRLRSRNRPKPHPRTRSQAPRWRCCNKPNQPKCPNHPPPTMPLLRVGVRTMTGGVRHPPNGPESTEGQLE